MPISQILATSCAELQLRPLPSTGVTRLPRYYEPVRHLVRPGLSLAGCRLEVTRLHRRGFPCCVRSPCACMPSPLPRRNRWPPSLGHGPTAAAFPESRRSASALVFSRLAQRSLTLRPARSPAAQGGLSIGGFGCFVASTASPTATGRSDSSQAGIAPAEDLRLYTAHGTPY